MLNYSFDDDFVGRNQEINLFIRWLDDLDPVSPWILFVHDALEKEEEQGGVGKSWLLRKCAALARERAQTAVVMIDFFSVSHRNGAEIAWQVVESLKPVYPAWSSQAFELAFQNYRLALQEGKDISEALSNIYRTLTGDLQHLEAKLVDDRKNLLIFFDTFERIESNPSIATLSLLHPSFPDNYNFSHMKVMIAGRNAPDWAHPNWQGREQEVQLAPLKPFSILEMVNFVNERVNLDEELKLDSLQAQTLHRRTQGRPIMLGLVTDVLKYGGLGLSRLLSTGTLNFEEYLVSRINELDKPINWVVLFMSHIYHRFNPDILAWLLDNAIGAQPGFESIAIDQQDLWARLLDLSFVRRSLAGDSNDVVLHDEMRRLINKYIWSSQDPYKESMRRDLSLSMITYYEQKRSISISSGIDQGYTSEYQGYIVELLYHKLYVDRQEGQKFFMQHFSLASELWLTAFARTLLQELQPFLDNYPNDFSSEWRSNLRFEEVGLLRKEQKYNDAQQLCRELEDKADAKWLENRLADVYFERGENYRLASQYDDANHYLQKALDIEMQRGNKMRIATIRGRIGYISMRRGELKNAAHYYQKNLQILKELGSAGRFGYSDMLASLSNVNRLLGEYDDARRRATLALRIRRELHREGHASEISVARTLGTLGRVYHTFDELSQALQCYDEALEIFERLQFREGRALIYGRLGQIALDQNDLPKALELFKWAYSTSLHIHKETEINSLNKQGWTLARMNQLEQALEFLKRAASLAHQERDYYQEAESLLDLMNIYERLGEHENSRRSHQEAVAIVFKYKYYYLLGRADYSLADIYYNRSDFQKAFKYYGEYCYYMALFNEIEFEKAVRKTTDRLNGVPPSKLPDIITSLRDYWSSLLREERKLHLLSALDEAEILITDL